MNDVIQPGSLIYVKNNGRYIPYWNQITISGVGNIDVYETYVSNIKVCKSQDFIGVGLIVSSKKIQDQFGVANNYYYVTFENANVWLRHATIENEFNQSR